MRSSTAFRPRADTAFRAPRRGSRAPRAVDALHGNADDGEPVLSALLRGRPRTRARARAPHVPAIRGGARPLRARVPGQAAGTRVPARDRGSTAAARPLPEERLSRPESVRFALRADGAHPASHAGGATRAR